MWCVSALAQGSCRGHGTFSPLLTANVCITRHETFNSMSLGNWFYTSRKGGQGEVGWYTQRVKTAWPCMGLLWKSLSNRSTLFMCSHPGSPKVSCIHLIYLVEPPCSVQGWFHLPEQFTINVLRQLTAILCAAWSRKAIRHRSCLVFIGASLREPHLALLPDEICVCRPYVRRIRMYVVGARAMPMY